MRDTHRDRQTRGTHTLRETPSSRKRHTLLRARHTHTHTEGEKLKQGELDTYSHTERDTQTLRERHTHNLEGKTHTLSNTHRHYERDPLH